MENVKEYRLKIVTGQYQNAPLDQQKMIQELFEKNAEHSYEIYFHWYNVIHELGHAIMMFNSSSRPHPAEEEQMVNDFAYAYWKYYGEQEKLKELDSIIEETISLSSGRGNEIVFCEDVNCHMCQIENLRDGRIF